MRRDLRTGLLLAVALGLSPLAAAQPVGGQVARPENWQFFAALRSVDTSTQELTYFCGGALIAPNWVVTAAHCLNGSRADAGLFRRANGSAIEVVVSVHDVLSVRGDQVYQIAAAYVHPQYRSVSGHPHDIALVQLSRTSPAPVLAMRSGGAANVEVAQVAGFGRTDENARLVQNTLRSGYTVSAGTPSLLEVSVFSLGSCSSAYPSRFDGRTQLCFGMPNGGQDSCQGDSGGPLVYRNADGSATLIGVVSFGRGCARSDAPGVYTSVQAHASWLTSVIERSSPDQDE